MCLGERDITDDINMKKGSVVVMEFHFLYMVCSAHCNYQTFLPAAFWKASFASVKNQQHA